MTHGRLKLFALILTLSPALASANPVETYIGLGVPLVQTDLDASTRHALEAKIDFEAGIMVHLQDLPFAVGAYYDAYLNSHYGKLPTSSSGIQISYYPFTRPWNQENISNYIFVKSTGLTFYGTAGSGLTFFNYGNKDEDVFIGAAAFNFRLSGTLIYPIGEQVLLGINAGYTTTFGGEDQSVASASTPSPVGLTGFTFSARVSYLIF